MECLNNWNTSSWVRNKELSYYEENQNECFFKPSLIPELKYIDPKDKELISQLQKLHLLSYLDATDKLETDIINVSILNLIRLKLPFKIPNQLIDEAYKIYVDETFHAYASYNLKNLLFKEEQHYATLPHQGINALKEILKELQEEEYIIAHLFACIINETLISGNLLQVNDPSLNPAVRYYLGMHARDEAKHHIFFANLFKLIWPQLSDSEKCKYGKLFPYFIKAFLLPNKEIAANHLSLIGFTLEEVHMIINNSYIDSEILSQVVNASKITIKYFNNCNIFAEHVIREAFHNEGFKI